MKDFTLIKKGVKAADNSDTDRAAVSIAFDNLRLSTVTSASITEGSVNLDDLVFQCEAIIKTVPDYTFGIDKSGNLDISPAKVTAKETKDEWIENAHKQRERLLNTENGQEMIITYGTYNNEFNDVFDKCPFFVKTKWDDKGGVTSAMCADTHSSVKQGDKFVNDKTYSVTGDNGDTNTSTYNSNAYARAYALAASLINLAKLYPEKKDKYNAASEAITNFDKAVGTTKNSDKETTPMTAGDIYGVVESDKSRDAVASSTGCMDPMSVVDEYYKNRISEIKNGADPVSLGEDKYGIEDFYIAMLEWNAENPQSQGKCLSPANCKAVITGVKLDRGSADLTSDQIVIPEFDFDIDDSLWSDEIKSAVSEFLSSSKFIRTRLTSEVQELIFEQVKYKDFSSL
jgi:hypothetical protein